MVQRQEIDAYLRELLSVDRSKDYGPNGLQVEGRASVARIVCGVTASLAFLSCGHHATERYGVQAVGQALAERFGLAVDFIDVDNPA